MMHPDTIHDRRFIELIYRHVQCTTTVMLNMAQDLWLFKTSSFCYVLI